MNYEAHTQLHLGQEQEMSRQDMFIALLFNLAVPWFQDNVCDDWAASTDKFIRCQDSICRRKLGELERRKKQ